LHEPPHDNPSTECGRRRALKVDETLTSRIEPTAVPISEQAFSARFLAESPESRTRQRTCL